MLAVRTLAGGGLGWNSEAPRKTLLKDFIGADWPQLSFGLRVGPKSFLRGQNVQHYQHWSMWRVKRDSKISKSPPVYHSLMYSQRNQQAKSKRTGIFSPSQVGGFHVPDKTAFSAMKRGSIVSGALFFFKLSVSYEQLWGYRKCVQMNWNGVARSAIAGFN